MSQAVKGLGFAARWSVCLRSTQMLDAPFTRNWGKTHKQSLNTDS